MRSSCGLPALYSDILLPHTHLIAFSFNRDHARNFLSFVNNFLCNHMVLALCVARSSLSYYFIFYCSNFFTLIFIFTCGHLKILQFFFRVEIGTHAPQKKLSPCKNRANLLSTRKVNKVTWLNWVCSFLVIHKLITWTSSSY